MVPRETGDCVRRGRIAPPPFGTPPLRVGGLARRSIRGVRMSRSLVIVESPTKVRTISKYLGPGYEVRSSMGHVRDLPERELGVDVEHGFRPEYTVLQGKEKIVRDLKALGKQA